MDNIPNDKLKYGEVLGRGSYGEVKRGTYGGFPVAIKTIHEQHLSGQQQGEFMEEAKLMAKFSDPNVVHLYGVCLKPYAIVMEYVEGGTLYDLIKKKAIQWDSEGRKIAMTLAYGLETLHANKVIHRDLKSPNILIDRQGGVKITDLGLSRLKLQSLTLHTDHIRGTYRWMAPEQFSDGEISSAIDVYAYGVIVWEIFARKVPFAHIKNSITVVQHVAGGGRETIPDICPPDVKRLILECWRHNPKQRPAATKLIEFFKSSPVEKTFNEGLAALRAGKIGDAVASFKKAMAHPPAQLYLYLLCQGQEIDSLQSVGTALLSLVDHEQEYKKGAAGKIAWFKQRAATQDPEAQYQLGLCYEHGLGVEASDTKAKELYKLAADQGHPQANKK